MNASFIRRVGAYLIDLIIAVVLMATVSFLFDLKTNDSIIELNSKLKDLNVAIIDQEITYNKYVYEYSDIVQNLDKLTMPTNVICLIVLIILYIVVPYKNNGSTIGKRLMHIKLVKEDGKDISIKSLIFRSFLINYIGYLFISISTVFLLNSVGYFFLTTILILFEILLVFISGFMVSYRHDKRGMHDLLTHTKVVKIKR